MDNRMNPLREGQEYDEIKIIAEGSKGDGMCRIEGVVVFVPNTRVNKEYRIKITAVRKTVAFGEIIE